MPLRKTRNKRKSARSRKQRSKTIGKRRVNSGPSVVGGRQLIGGKDTHYTDEIQRQQLLLQLQREREQRERRERELAENLPSLEDQLARLRQQGRQDMLDLFVRL